MCMPGDNTDDDRRVDRPHRHGRPHSALRITSPSTATATPRPLAVGSRLDHGVGHRRARRQLDRPTVQLDDHRGASSALGAATRPGAVSPAKRPGCATWASGGCGVLGEQRGDRLGGDRRQQDAVPVVARGEHEAIQRARTDQRSVVRRPRSQAGERLDQLQLRHVGQGAVGLAKQLVDAPRGDLDVEAALLDGCARRSGDRRGGAPGRRAQRRRSARQTGWSGFPRRVRICPFTGRTGGRAVGRQPRGGPRPSAGGQHDVLGAVLAPVRGDHPDQAAFLDERVRDLGFDQHLAARGARPRRPGRAAAGAGRRPPQPGRGRPRRRPGPGRAPGPCSRAGAATPRRGRASPSARSGGAAPRPRRDRARRGGRRRARSRPPARCRRRARRRSQARLGPRPARGASTPPRPSSLRRRGRAFPRRRGRLRRPGWSRSSTRTRRPRRAARHAQASPSAPPPTTTASSASGSPSRSAISSAARRRRRAARRSL